MDCRPSAQLQLPCERFARAMNPFPNPINDFARRSTGLTRALADPEIGGPTADFSTVTLTQIGLFSKAAGALPNEQTCGINPRTSIKSSSFAGRAAKPLIWGSVQGQ